MKTSLALAAAVVAPLLLGCRPDLPDASGAGGDAGPRDPAVRSEPVGAPGSTPLVTWLHVDAPGLELAPDDVVLVEGTLGSASLDKLARGAASDALLERVVPSTRWRSGSSVVVAPHRPLLPDVEYAVALLPLGASLTLRTVAEALPLHTVFPADGRAGMVRVVCRVEAWPPLDADVPLAPEGPTARLVRGTPRGAAPGCLVLEVPRPGGPWHAPPAVEVEGVVVALDPAPVVGVPVPSPGPLACEPAEVPFGLGCARVSDDRVVLRTPDEPLFWVLSGGVDAAFVSEGQPVVVRGFLPDRSQTVGVEVLDEAGRWTTRDVALRTLPPRAHLVISEVYADAVGPEPEQEWIELVNEGLAPGTLEGYALLDPGGRTELPAVSLPPGAYALLVGDGFDPAAPWDAPIPSDVALARVPRVGKSGLSNQGEPLLLEGPDGVVESAFAPSPTPRPGVSVARRHPSSPDHDPESFARAVLGPTPGAPNDGSFEE